MSLSFTRIVAEETSTCVHASSSLSEGAYVRLAVKGGTNDLADSASRRPMRTPLPARLPSSRSVSASVESPRSVEVSVSDPEMAEDSAPLVVPPKSVSMSVFSGVRRLKDVGRAGFDWDGRRICVIR